MRNKNLFVGSMGRFSDQGGARMFTTPNTIYVPPEYEIDVGLNENDKVKTCSLDGRLWIFDNKIIVFKGNRITSKIEFVTSVNLENETIIARGINWILTKKSIIKAIENAPYFAKKKLYNNDDDNTEISYNANDIAKNYAFLPSIGDWQIIGSKFILSPEKNIDEKDKRVCNANVLEFHYLDYNNVELSNPENIYLLYHDGTLYAKGSNRIGKIYILPCIIKEKKDENDEDKFEEFYIYICPDKLYKSDDIDENWNHLGLASILEVNKKHIYGFILQKTNSLDEGLYEVSQNAKLFDFTLNDWNTITKNSGRIYFNNFNNSGISIYDEGITNINNNEVYKSNALIDWLKPTGEIIYINKNMCFSRINKKDILITYIHAKSRFYREKLSNKILPCSIPIYSKQGLALGINKNKKFEINTIKFQDESKTSIIWNNISVGKNARLYSGIIGTNVPGKLSVYNGLLFNIK